jgi:hypothetical protein
MNREDKMDAFYRLTREIRSMHHTERTALANSANYDAALTAVLIGLVAEERPFKATGDTIL